MNNNYESMIREAVKKARDSVGHATVLIAGKTGVGKSTLVNSVFQGELATTGTGRPVTQNTREYTKEGIPLTIIDTKGIEVVDYESTKAQLKEAIKTRNEDPDAKKHIHVGWICISEDSRRVEDADVELVKMLQEFKIPVVAVITKARSDSGFKSEVQRLLDDCRQVVRVRAIHETFDDEIQLPPMGLKELVEVTCQLFPEGQKNAFIAAQKVDLAKKRESSHMAVATAALSAGGVAAIPIPFSDAVGIVPIQIGMLAAISAIFGLKINEGFLSTVLSSAFTAVGGTLAGRAIVGGLLKLVPGVGSVVGGIVSSTTAATLTTAFGEAYIHALSALLEQRAISDVTPNDIAKAFVARLRNGK